MKLSPVDKGKDLWCGLGVLICSMALWAIPVRAAGPGSNPVHVETTLQATLSSAAYGPVGPGCDVSAGGPSCAFVDLFLTESGKDAPFGPFSSKRTLHILFGVNGAFFTPSGSHDGAGNSTGVCVPEIDTFTNTYSDGSTLSFTGQGSSCCAAADCPGNPLGPPTTGSLFAVITGGTGKFAGATGGHMELSVGAPSGSNTNFLGTAEGVVVLQRK